MNEWRFVREHTVEGTISTRIITMPDRRDPPLIVVPEYRRFRQQLSASEHLSVLADMLRHVVMLYDGTIQEPPRVLEPRYLKAAEMAVRYSSEEARASAQRCAEAHAISKFETLVADLRSPDATEDVRIEQIAQYAADVISVYVWHLKMGCGRSREEISEFERCEARDGV